MDGDNAIEALARAIEADVLPQDRRRGASVSGTQHTAVQALIKLDMSTVVAGEPAFLDAANDRLLIPAGANGLYLVSVQVGVVGIAPGQTARFSIRTTSVTIPSNAGILADGGFGIYSNAGAVGGMAQWIGPAVAGDDFAVHAEGSAADPGNFNLWRAAIVRLGDGFAV
jgi:hypothetical protein